MLPILPGLGNASNLSSAGSLQADPTSKIFWAPKCSHNKNQERGMCNSHIRDGDRPGRLSSLRSLTQRSRIDLIIDQRPGVSPSQMCQPHIPRPVFALSSQIELEVTSCKNSSSGLKEKKFQFIYSSSETGTVARLRGRIYEFELFFSGRF